MGIFFAISAYNVIIRIGVLLTSGQWERAAASLAHNTTPVADNWFCYFQFSMPADATQVERKGAVLRLRAPRAKTGAQFANIKQ